MEKNKKYKQMIPALIIILIGILLLKAALKPHHIYQPSNSIFKKIAESLSKSTSEKNDASTKNNLSEEDNTSAKNNSAINKNISSGKNTNSSNTSQTTQKNIQQKDAKSDSEIILSTKEGKNKIIHYGPSVDTIEFLKDYNTIEELMQDADNIVLGTVKEKNSYMDEEGTVVYTDYSVELKKVYKGKLKEKLKKKENIHIIDLGGRIKASKYFAKQDDPKFKKAKEQTKKNPDTTYVQYNFGSNWQPEISNQYLWFLTTNNSDEQTRMNTKNTLKDGEKIILTDNLENQTYTPLNSWQGIYRLTANKKEQYFQRYTIPDYEDNAAQITLVNMEKKLK